MFSTKSIGIISAIPLPHKICWEEIHLEKEEPGRLGGSVC